MNKIGSLGYQEVKEDRLWAVADRSKVLELAMRRRIPNLTSRLSGMWGHHPVERVLSGQARLPLE